MKTTTATKGRSFLLGLAALAITSFATGCGNSNAAVIAPKSPMMAANAQTVGQTLKEAPISEGTWVQGEPAPHQKKGAVTVQRGKEVRLWYFETNEVPMETYGSFRLYLTKGDKRLLSHMDEGKPINLYEVKEIGDPGLVHPEWSRTWSFGIKAPDAMPPGTYPLVFKAVQIKWSDAARKPVPTGEDPLVFTVMVKVTP